MASLSSVRERLRMSLWFIPMLLAAAAVACAVILVAIDREIAAGDASPFFSFGGSPEGARSVLSTIAQSMLAFTGLVFSITMLVLQLASGQLSPRVTRTFLRDRGNQVVLGLFVATLVFTLLVLREVRTPVDGAPFVPAVAVWVAFALLLASVAAFIWYIDHMAHAIRASTVIAGIWDETTDAIDRLYPERVGHEPDRPGDAGPATAPGLVLSATDAGVVVTIDEERLRRVAEAEERVLQVVPRVGEFVTKGAPLAFAWGPWDRSAADDVRGAMSVGNERTLEQDAAFGFRQLVDIAVRALSPGINDPTTAGQALDRLHDLLRRLVDRRIPAAERVIDGRVRLILPRPDWDEYLGLAVEEIRVAGANQPAVVRRLGTMLDDLAGVAPEDRLAAIRREQRRLEDVASTTGDRPGTGGGRRSAARLPQRS